MVDKKRLRPGARIVSLRTPERQRVGVGLHAQLSLMTRIPEVLHGLRMAAICPTHAYISGARRQIRIV